MERIRKNKKGITLVALVITIIILIILAGVTIGQLTKNGLFEKIQVAKEKSESAQKLENNTLSDYENIIDDYINNSRNIVSSYKILFDNLDGAEEGTLKESINNFDILVAIYGTPIAGEKETESKIFTPTYSKLEFNFATEPDYIYGWFSFDNQNFTKTIAGSNQSEWYSRYKIYQVIGIKF